MIEKFAAVGMSLFGYGSLEGAVPFLQREKIQKMLIVTDASINRLGLLEPVKEVITRAGAKYEVYDGVLPNPTIKNVEEGLNKMKESGCDSIAAVGGGSANDCAKAIRILEANGGSIKDYTGGGKARKKGKYLMAVNTTAGTGSEVSRAFLVSDEVEKRKLIFKDDYALPDLAVNDVQLMMKLPASITAQTGMDALTHAIESYISCSRFKLTNILAEDAVRLIIGSLEKAVTHPDDREARVNMALGQYLAGLSFGSAGLGLVHAMAHQIGATYHLPHGLCNAALLPVVMEYDCRYCTKEFAALAHIVAPEKCGKKNEKEKAWLAVETIKMLSCRVGTYIGLEELGVLEKDVKELARRATEDGCILTSPKIPEKKEIEELFRKAMKQK